MSIDKILAQHPPRTERTKPLWEGPESAGKEGGVTFSMLSRFLACRERFRLKVVKGLGTDEGWHHKFGYGDMWHICEEAHAEGIDPLSKLRSYGCELCERYPTQQEVIDHWYNVCKVQFLIYVKYWEKHDDVVNRQPLLQEQVFKSPYVLPSGRKVYLRGKFDSVDMMIDKGKPYIWLQENKTKGDIYEQKLISQLTFDLQTMIYLTVLQKYDWTGKEFNGYGTKKKPYPLKGVRYNVIRRPLSGGKGTIVRHQATKGAKCSKCKGLGTLDKLSSVHGKLLISSGICPKCAGKGRIGAKPMETKAAFYQRVAKYIEQEPQEYFMRWNVEVTAEEIKRFQMECLNPLLENLLEWWDWITSAGVEKYGPFHGGGGWGVHFRYPYGVYNVTAEGGISDYDSFLDTGSEIGLKQVDTLFPELSEL